MLRAIRTWVFRVAAIVTLMPVSGASAQSHGPERAATGAVRADGPGRVPDDIADPRRDALAYGCGGVAVVGFVEGDATAALQAAFDSGVCRVVIPNVGEPWLTGPLFVRRDGLTIELEPGVELRALPGRFPGQGDSLVTAQGVDGFTLRGGAGATLRMLNGLDADYLDGEWRHAIKLVGVDRVRISGLTVIGSGGDGVFVGGTWAVDASHRPSTDVVIRGCVFVDNRRQGISVISVEGFLVSGCVFRDTGATSGTDPMAGIDFEPDVPVHRIVGCRVENSVFIDNRASLYSTGVHMYLGNLDGTSSPVDITVERVTVRSAITDGAAIGIGGPYDDGPATSIVLRDVTVETSRGIGLYARTSVANTSVLLERVRLFDTHTDPAPWLGAPIYLDGQSGRIETYGGIEFVDCLVVDDRARPVIKAYEDRDHLGLPPASCRWLTGTLRVQNPSPLGLVVDLGGPNDSDIGLVIVPE